MNDMKIRPMPGAAGALLLALAISPPGAFAQPLNIDVILPLTGGGAFVGKGQQQSLDALADEVNKTGGIKGRELHFVYHDDQTSPQVSVQLANDILANHPPVMLGSSLVAMCAAIAPLMTGTVDYCLSPGYHPAAGSYVFSSSASSIDQVAAVIRYFRLRGWTKMAALETTDASGQDGDRAIAEVLARPENKDVKLVAHEHYNPTDMSVAAQIERIRASGAEALINWATGAPVATVFKGIVQSGLDIPVAPTSGNQTFAQMEQWASFLPKQLYMPSAAFPPHDGLYKLDPRVEKVQHDMYAALAAHDLKPDNMAATSWDAALIVVDALRRLGPDAKAEAIRNEIANLTDFAGIDGIYDFKKYPERGLGPESSIVVRYEAKPEAWVWISKPGGAPLDGGK
jgi:branched-chain amino acid transport system substrate-binding protein